MNKKWDFVFFLKYIKKISFYIFILIIFSFFDIAIRFIFPWIYKFTFDKYIPSNFAVSIFYHIVFIMLLLIIIQIASNFVIQIFLQKFKTNIIQSIRIELLNKILSYKYNFFLSNQTGNLINYLIPEIDKLSDIFVNIFNLIISSLQLIIFLFILFFIDKLICLTMFSILILCFIWTFFLKKIVNKYSNKIIELQGDIYSFFFELFPKIKEIKAYNMYDFQKNRLNIILNKNKNINIKSSFYNSLYSLVFYFPSFIGSILIIIIGFYKIKSGDYTFGMVILLLFYSGVVAFPMENIFSSFSFIRNGWPTMSHLKQIFANKTEVIKGKDIKQIFKSIDLRNLSYSYSNKVDILKKVNLKFNCNNFFAIIGESGSGKTTLINLLVKLFQFSNNTIFFDDNDLNNIKTESVRQLISLVTQETFILNDSLRNNIDFNQKLNDTEILQICKEAELMDLIKKLPNGINTILADKGMNLSSGEKQRLMIARCLAKNTYVIILDEATSALDIKTEEKIIKILLKLKKIKKNFLIIAITHRPSFAKYSDYIIVLDKGKVVESGRHDVLLAKKKFYYNLFYSNQGITC